jgi:hypothetical protein
MNCPVGETLDENLAGGRANLKSALSHLNNSSSSISYQRRLEYHERSLALVEKQQTEARDHISQCLVCLNNLKLYHFGESSSAA